MNYDIDITRKNRILFEKFLNEFSLEQLNRVPKGFKNNIIWNIAHCIVTQQLLIYKLSGLQGVLSDEMIAEFRKGTKTERDLSQAEVDEIRSLLFLPLVFLLANLSYVPFTSTEVHTLYNIYVQILISTLKCVQ